MKTCPLLSVALAFAAWTAWGGSSGTNAPVIVWYEREFIRDDQGRDVRKVVTIPWSDELTFVKAIVTAGGYVTPPTRVAILVRDKVTAELKFDDICLHKAPDPHLLPGDLIELRATLDRRVQGQEPPAGMRAVSVNRPITNAVPRKLPQAPPASPGGSPSAGP